MRRITTKNLTSKGRLRGGLFVADEATRRQLQNLGQRPTYPGVASAPRHAPGVNLLARTLYPRPQPPLFVPPANPGPTDLDPDAYS
jgi:hypothetical protein